MTWSQKRKLAYGFIFFLLLLGVIALIVVPIITRAPSCADLKQNGDEKGVDCGGSCVLYCPSEISPIIVLYARSFPVTDSTYNAVASIENQNVRAITREISYVFKLYDKDNVLITERTGKTFISSNSRSAIFEPALQVGNRIPVYTRFYLTSNPQWLRATDDQARSLLTVENKKVESLDTTPFVSAEIVNNSLATVSRIPVIAIVYDQTGNAIGASRTLVDELLPDETEEVFFTWQHPFTDPNVYVEIIPRVDPYAVMW
jgi:hypothetical protein